MNRQNNQTDPVRAFLSSVAEARIEARRLGFRVRRLEARATKLTASLTGMPSGHGDSGDLLATLADLRSTCERSRVQAELQEAAVEQFIDRLEDSTSRIILKLRYCDCLNWVDRPHRRSVIGELGKAGLNYSERQVYRLHGIALNEARKLYKEIENEESRNS